MKVVLVLLLVGLASCSNLVEALKAKPTSSIKVSHAGALAWNIEYRSLYSILSFQMAKKDLSGWAVKTPFLPLFQTPQGAIELVNAHKSTLAGIISDFTIEGNPFKVLWRDLADGCVDTLDLLSFGAEKMWMCPTNNHILAGCHRTLIVSNGAWINNQDKANWAVGDFKNKAIKDGL